MSPAMVIEAPCPCLGLCIDGAFLHGGGRREQPIPNPADHAAIGQLPHATRDDAASALVGAELPEGRRQVTEEHYGGIEDSGYGSESFDGCLDTKFVTERS